ncbi:hypothetical protein H5410_027200, partial [Solanum commersonii]
MHTTRLNLLMKRSNVHSKIQVVNHQYQRISYSQYLLQMQFKVLESVAMLTLTNKNIMHNFTHSFPVFSNQHLFQHTQDQKGLFKDCNGVECK